jgi:hypothetical protein
VVESEEGQAMNQELEAQLEARRVELARLQREFEDAVSAYYRPLAESACRAKAFDEAWAIAVRAPDSVSRVLLMDTVRTARGDYERCKDNVDGG